MSGSSIAIDTNVAIGILADEAGALLGNAVGEFLLPVPVVGELRYGALNSRRTAGNLAEVERLTDRCRVLNITTATAAVYARLRLQLKQKGQPIPENDLWIAALCVEHHVPLASLDGPISTLSTNSPDIPGKRTERTRSSASFGLRPGLSRVVAV